MDTEAQYSFLASKKNADMLKEELDIQSKAMEGPHTLI